MQKWNRILEVQDLRALPTLDAAIKLCASAGKASLTNFSFDFR